MRYSWHLPLIVASGGMGFVRVVLLVATVWGVSVLPLSGKPKRNAEFEEAVAKAVEDVQDTFEVMEWALDTAIALRTNNQPAPSPHSDSLAWFIERVEERVGTLPEVEVPPQPAPLPSLPSQPDNLRSVLEYSTLDYFTIVGDYDSSIQEHRVLRVLSRHLNLLKRTLLNLNTALMSILDKVPHYEAQKILAFTALDCATYAETTEGLIEKVNAFATRTAAILAVRHTELTRHSNDLLAALVIERTFVEAAAAALEKRRLTIEQAATGLRLKEQKLRQLVAMIQARKMDIASIEDDEADTEMRLRRERQNADRARSDISNLNYQLSQQYDLCPNRELWHNCTHEREKAQWSHRVSALTVQRNSRQQELSVTERRIRDLSARAEELAQRREDEQERLASEEWQERRDRAETNAEALRIKEEQTKWLQDAWKSRANQLLAGSMEDTRQIVAVTAKMKLPKGDK